MQTLGFNHYALTSHLGNVLSVVTDNINISPDSAFAKIVAATDYYAFGSEMPGRTYSSPLGGGEEGAYRYGFNGKEKDTENTWGDTNYDYGFRIYNPRYGKFLSVDPLTKDYPMLTPFQFASNTPIRAIDIDGLEAFVAIYQNQGRDGQQPILNTMSIDPIKDALNLELTIHNSRVEYPKAFEGVSDVDGVTILIDSKGKYLGRVVSPGIIIKGHIPIDDVRSGLFVFGSYLQNTLGKRVNDFRDATKQVELGVEFKLGIPSINVGFEAGTYSTKVNNVGLFGLAGGTFDLNSVSLTTDVSKFEAKFEFFMKFKQNTSNEEPLISSPEKAKIFFNTPILKLNSDSEGTTKLSFGSGIRLGKKTTIGAGAEKKFQIGGYTSTINLSN